MASIIFFGTPEIAIPFLDGLCDSSVRPALIVTQPDRPQGRGNRLGACPVKQRAHALGVNVIQPHTVNDIAALARLASVHPDLFVVVAFGQIFSKELLDAASFGAVNVHFSLLPHLRGATPIQEALLRGDTQTGVSIIQMDEKLDHGPLVAQCSFAIDPRDTQTTLTKKAVRAGVPLLIKAVQDILNGHAYITPQDHSRATFTRKITRDMEKIDWTRDAPSIDRLIRAFTPTPGAWTEFHGKRLMIREASPYSPSLPEGLIAQPGAVLLDVHNALVAICGVGALRLTRVQLEGKDSLSETDFINGYRRVLTRDHA